MMTLKRNSVLVWFWAIKKKHELIIADLKLTNRNHCFPVYKCKICYIISSLKCIKCVVVVKMHTCGNLRLWSINHKTVIWNYINFLKVYLQLLYVIFLNDIVEFSYAIFSCHSPILIIKFSRAKNLGKIWHNTSTYWKNIFGKRYILSRIIDK